LLAGSAVLVGSAVVSAGVNAAPGKPVRTLAGNRRAARRDAPGLLRALRLPAGAVSAPGEPRGDGGWLRPQQALVATPARADVHTWWRVLGRPDVVLAYVEAHPPSGAKLFTIGSGHNDRTGRTVLNVSYTWPAIPGLVGFRELAISATALSGTVTGVLAQAESDWILPRPPSERVPARTREIDITTAKLAGQTTAALSVTNAAKVRRIVSLINAMPIAQPGLISCPELQVDGARVITIKFQARAGAPPLARATYTDYPPLTAPSGRCTPISFSIGGRVQHPLIGGDFLKKLQRILGVRLI
jgi:hypothetical protein